VPRCHTRTSKVQEDIPPYVLRTVSTCTSSTRVPKKASTVPATRTPSPYTAHVQVSDPYEPSLFRDPVASPRLQPAFIGQAPRHGDPTSTRPLWPSTHQPTNIPPPRYGTHQINSIVDSTENLYGVRSSYTNLQISNLFPDAVPSPSCRCRKCQSLTLASTVNHISLFFFCPLLCSDLVLSAFFSNLLGV
jgi:hypothetical protein